VIDRSEFLQRVQWLARACETRRASSRWKEGEGSPPKIEVSQPAMEADILKIEKAIGGRLPEAYRTPLALIAREVDIGWQLREPEQPPIRNIFAGECRWSPREIEGLLETYQGWLRDCFDDPADDYGSVWYGKFPILSVGNGDMVAIDLKTHEVVYLSHDDGEGHGARLGSDFLDYIDRLTILGCVGAEHWQWAPFLSTAQPYLQTECEHALTWRKWFGLLPRAA
jgi:hypothetical protein